MKYLLIANPISGTDGKKKLTDIARKCLAKVGINSHTIFTTKSGDALHFARKAADDGYDAIIAFGGDGTVNEVASGIVGSECSLGIIPMGSGNGLARHLAIPLNPLEALGVILKGDILRCDFASANGLNFFCTFGVGFDGSVAHRFAKSRRRGKIAYLRSIIECSRTYRPATYSVELPAGKFEREAFILAVCNSSQYGNNAFIAPYASLTDGMLDMTVVNPINPIDYVRNSFELFTGLISNNGRFETLRSPRFIIRRPGENLAHLDGEPFIFHDEIDIRCHHLGLKVFCSGEPRFKPFLTPISGTIQDIHSAITKPFI